GPEGFAVLYLEVEHRLHGRRARVAQDRAGAQRARAELHAPLEPPDRLAFGERGGGHVKEFALAENLERRAHATEPLLEVRLRELRAKVGPGHAVARGHRPRLPLEAMIGEE